MNPQIIEKLNELADHCEADEYPSGYAAWRLVRTLMETLEGFDRLPIDQDDIHRVKHISQQALTQANSTIESV